MVSVLTVASASACNFQVPPFLVQKGARLSHFSCDDLTPSCCAGVQDVVSVTGSGKGLSPEQVTKDTIGTCGRADQVNLYNCAVTKAPQIVPAGKEGKVRQIIKSKFCGNVEVKSTSMDGSGQCSFSKGGHTLQIDGVSTGCCAAWNAIADEEQRGGEFDEAKKAAVCGLIGACGKQDQQSMLKFVEKMKRNSVNSCATFTAGEHIIATRDFTSHDDNPRFVSAGSEGTVNNRDENGNLWIDFDRSDLKDIFVENDDCANLRPASELLAATPLAELQLLETFNFPVGGPVEMMASFMPSEVEETTEDGTIDDRSQIMPGLLGFMAGAAVAGLGVTVLRRSAPSQDEYTEIVA